MYIGPDHTNELQTESTGLSEMMPIICCCKTCYKMDDVKTISSCITGSFTHHLRTLPISEEHIAMVRTQSAIGQEPSHGFNGGRNVG